LAKYIGEALFDERENPMGEALAIQTIVNATDAIFFEAATIVSDVMKIVCVTKKMFLIPETIVFSNEKIFWSAGTIFPVAQKMISRFATIFCISRIKVVKTRKMIEETQKCF
jgi:hypothetical protein